MSGSRALRMVVVTLLGASAWVAGEADAVSFCVNNRCEVRPPAWVPGFFGGGGGGGWGNDGNSGDPERDRQASWCMDFPYEIAQYGCDVYAPPELQVNGCGTATGMPVPDFLLSPVRTVEAAAQGGIFTVACNNHDACYGRAGANKADCDEKLRVEMINFGMRDIKAPFKAMFAPFVSGQAWAYAKFLQWESVAPWTSDRAFNAAQDQGYCRRWATEHRQICR